MSVTERQRMELSRWLEEQMGPERAASLMTMLPPAGWGDVATAQDVHRVEQRLDRLEHRFDALVTELRARDSRYLTWLFTTHGALVAGAGLFAAFS